MFAVIKTNRDGSETALRTCRTKEAALIASQLEKNLVSPAERGTIRAVAMDDEGYSEIMF